MLHSRKENSTGGLGWCPFHVVRFMINSEYKCNFNTLKNTNFELGVQGTSIKLNIRVQWRSTRYKIIKIFSFQNILNWVEKTPLDQLAPVSPTNILYICIHTYNGICPKKSHLGPSINVHSMNRLRVYHMYQYINIPLFPL